MDASQRVQRNSVQHNVSDGTAWCEQRLWADASAHRASASAQQQRVSPVPRDGRLKRLLSGQKHVLRVRAWLQAMLFAQPALHVHWLTNSARWLRRYLFKYIIIGDTGAPLRQNLRVRLRRLVAAQRSLTGATWQASGSPACCCSSQTSASSRCTTSPSAWSLAHA